MSAWRLAAATAAVACALLAAPGGAPAATSCSFNAGGGLLFVDMNEANDQAFLTVAAGPSAEIVVVGRSGQVPCTGAATPVTTNTDSINILNQPGATGTVVRIDGTGRFGPGVESELGGTREIEFFVNLRDDPGSQLVVADDGVSMRLGTDGINPNAFGGEVAPDADIFFAGVPDGGLVIAGGPSGDVLGAQGGAGTARPRTDRVVLQGLGGPDSLTGGEGADTLVGEEGGDGLAGGGGDDVLRPGGGDDRVDGGPGIDTVDYADDFARVSIDLAIDGPQPTGAGSDSLAQVENVIGGGLADVLRGDDGPNALDGGAREDLIEGRGGEDTLTGGEGADTLDVRDGAADRVDCGAGADTVIADDPGMDLLTGCEIVVFPGAGGGVPAGGAGGGSRPPAASADSQPPAFLGRVRAVPARFRVARRRAKRRGTTFRYTLTEAAAVTFRIERLARGRRARRAGSFRVRGAAGANRTRFSGRIGRTLLRPGAYRAVLTATDAAGNRSAPARARFRVVRGRAGTR
jgi:Ca2+-binding RTX toxin-like protein